MKGVSEEVSLQLHKRFKCLRYCSESAVHQESSPDGTVTNRKGRSPGLRLIARFHLPIAQVERQWSIENALRAYSCEDSYGFAPYSLLTRVGAHCWVRNL